MPAGGWVWIIRVIAADPTLAHVNVVKNCLSLNCLTIQ